MWKCSDWCLHCLTESRGCLSSRTTYLSAAWGGPILGEYPTVSNMCSQLLHGYLLSSQLQEAPQWRTGGYCHFPTPPLCLTSPSGPLLLQFTAVYLALTWHKGKNHSLRQHSLLLTPRACTQPDQPLAANTSWQYKTSGQKSSSTGKPPLPSGPFYVRNFLWSSPSIQTEIWCL